MSRTLQWKLGNMRLTLEGVPDTVVDEAVSIDAWFHMSTYQAGQVKAFLAAVRDIGVAAPGLKVGNDSISVEAETGERAKAMLWVNATDTTPQPRPRTPALEMLAEERDDALARRDDALARRDEAVEAGDR